MTRTLDLHVDTPWVVAKYGLWDTTLSGLNRVSMLSRKRGLDSAVFVMYLRDDWYDAEHGEGVLAQQAKWAQVQEREDFTVYLALEGWRTDKVSRRFIERHQPKYVTLVHAVSNELAESCTDLTGNGLTKQGLEAVKWLQAQGILVDLSHASVATCLDVLNETNGPVIASHSGANAITWHPRNLPDDVIRLIAETGGIIGVPMARNFVHDVNVFAEHIGYIADLVGPEHVAIGSDMDGAVMIPELRSAADWEGLVREAVVNTGALGHEIDGMMGGNALRLFETGSTISKGEQQC